MYEFLGFEPYIFLIVCECESHDAIRREKDSWNIAKSGGSVTVIMDLHFQ
jgi:hypothetical protein